MFTNIPMRTIYAFLSPSPLEKQPILIEKFPTNRDARQQHRRAQWWWSNNPATFCFRRFVGFFLLLLWLRQIIRAQLDLISNLPRSDSNTAEPLSLLTFKSTDVAIINRKRVFFGSVECQRKQIACDVARKFRRRSIESAAGSLFAYRIFVFVT